MEWSIPRRRLPRSLSRTWRRPARGLCDGFRACWTLPYRQVPWALPFNLTQAEAKDAFHVWSGKGEPGTPKITIQTLRPIHLPYYVFEGQLNVTFTGVVGYENGDSSSEFHRTDIRCPPIHLGADAGQTTAVYAGFDFRRLYVRQAVSRDISDALLRSAVPMNELTHKPDGAGVEAFKMKPSFAYLNRILERLPEVAYHEAERYMEKECVRALQFERTDGEARICPYSEARMPDFERVEDVNFEFDKTARFHDRGVVLLPVWVVEYKMLGHNYRAFVSALVAGIKPRVAGICPRSDDPGASGGMPGDAAFTWKTVGELREHESTNNQGWKVRRYWLDEVARVMPEWQKDDARRTRANRRNFGGFRSKGGGDEASSDDYALLGLVQNPPPTAAASKSERDARGYAHICSVYFTFYMYTDVAVASAFRAIAMTSHPDRQQGLTDAEHMKCTERFQQLLAAHSRLRRKHSTTE